MTPAAILLGWECDDGFGGIGRMARNRASTVHKIKREMASNHNTDTMTRVSLTP
jgi:hypothetical protein